MASCSVLVMDWWVWRSVHHATGRLSSRLKVTRNRGTRRVPLGLPVLAIATAGLRSVSHACACRIVSSSAALMSKKMAQQC